jgi:uncharacterized membrane protein YecN with MAPEG domain
MQEEYLDNSISLASKVEDEFESLGKKIKVVSETSPIYVLHKAYMPRVLLKWVLSLIIQRKYTRFRAGQNEIAKLFRTLLLQKTNITEMVEMKILLLLRLEIHIKVIEILRHP